MADQIEPLKPFEGVTAESVAGAAFGLMAGSSLGAGLGNPGVALAGAGLGALQPFGVRLVRLSQREFSLRQERADVMWWGALQMVGGSTETVLDALEQDEHLVHLATSAADAAGQSLYPERIVALARALANGLLTEESTVLDHEQGVIDALATIERPHLAIMSTFVIRERVDDGSMTTSESFDWDQMRQASGGYRRSLTPLLATLQREGLVSVDQASVYGGSADRNAGRSWRLSDYGLEVIARLHQVHIETASRGGSRTR